MASSDAAWTTCSICGGAVPPDGAACPTCGEARPVATREIPHLPSRIRRRVRFLQIVRIAIVVGVVVGLGYDVTSSLLAGPPTYPDPLTTRGTLNVTAGGFAYLSGSITGEDYVDGNYTVVSPYGVPIDFAVYNATEFAAFVGHEPAASIWSTENQSSARIVFAAPYTDTFSLVFENPYPPTSGINVTIYEVTNYQTNVVIG